mmetsp:Transcript_58695/g.163791  ORF Transcript_58695/g.163791 Transcript_58695/m.163791 type:complete len:520 (+) Transcript_58695:41-1600(+)
MVRRVLSPPPSGVGICLFAALQAGDPVVGLSRRALPAGEGLLTYNHSDEPTAVERRIILENDPNDWFFHSVTSICDETVIFDNASDSLSSRLFMLVLYSLCLLSVAWTANFSELPVCVNPLCIAEGRANEPVVPEEAQGQVSGSSTRLWHLDFARITAVMCVIFEHCGGLGYTRRNVGFGLWWALPFLYTTSGMASMRSKSSLAGYILRLALLLVVGVGANWAADVVTNRNWRGDFGNTIFQMFFVIMLMAMAVIMEPLRAALRVRQGTLAYVPHLRVGCGIATYGVATAVGFFYYLTVTPLLNFHFTSSFGVHYAPLAGRLPIGLVEFFGTCFLGMLACLAVQAERVGMVGWMLLAYILFAATVVPWQMGDFAQLLSLYVFGMVVDVFPLSGSKAIAAAVRAYWPLLFMLLCLLCQPDMIGRCDMLPPGTVWERGRHRAGEGIVMVCFATGALKTSDPYNVTVWMGWWALYAYAFHIAWYRLLGSPYGAVLTFASIGVFYAIYVCTRRSTKEDGTRPS